MFFNVYDEDGNMVYKTDDLRKAKFEADAIQGYWRITQDDDLANTPITDKTVNRQSNSIMDITKRMF